VLGRTSITVRELLHLQVGDVITLHQPIRQPLEIAVAGLTKMRGRAGTVGRQLGVQVTEVVAEELVVDEELEEAEAEEAMAG
jgi:flagellar motor switch protein FliM